VKERGYANRASGGSSWISISLLECTVLWVKVGVWGAVGLILVWWAEGQDLGYGAGGWDGLEKECLERTCRFCCC